MDLLGKAEDLVRSVRRQSLSKVVTYRRTIVTRVDECGLEDQIPNMTGTLDTLVATQAETRAQSDDGELILNTKIVDWLFEAADLFLTYELTEQSEGDEDYAASLEFDELAVPKPGDRIIWDGKTFELMAIGGEKCWRWHGRDGKSYRVHTRLVE